ncbi:P-loop containing nucleoside triphosphate hydrolase protein [Hymenopellis radicata]|nr:P-loop containing nucleoside triphosphate hydrolase protein [Hymenopellis radicata]
MTVSQFATWQQSANALGNALSHLMFSVHRIKRKYEDIRCLYASDDIQSAMKDGQIAYPQSEFEKSKGMSFELRNLSFSYPGSQNEIPTLRDISFVISSGQLIVVVGANGSGKSTLIKLLTRLHDCPSPDFIIVDGHPISEYRITDLRQATAVLTQEHTLFPLSLGENIGMGYVDKVGDLEAISRAAYQGGAKHCLEKLKDGLETTLDPKSKAGIHNVPADEAHPLNVEFKKLPKRIELSGGEQQRMVASRTFMRFESGRVKFVAVDEPTSALDAEGEAALFENLIKAREGKTLVFVTHRFGHLTKRADLILCLKDGTLAESGTHSELLALDGEYAKLYNIQAGAFSDGEKKTEES